MATAISKKLQLKVLDALHTAGTPLTTSEVAMLINRSFETTRHALSVVGAIRVDGTFPSEWTIDTSYIPSHIKQVPSKFDELSYTVTTKPFDTPIVLWNEQRDSLSKAIKALEIKPTDNPKDVAKKLGTTAGSIAHVAYRLSEVATRPDWYDILTQER
jgi:hypothetical protein